MSEDFDHASHRLKTGGEWPYDTPDGWEYGHPLPEAKDWAHRAARGIIRDMCDRRGIKWGFENIDADVRVEIVETTAEIIRRAYSEK